MTKTNWHSPFSMQINSIIAAKQRCVRFTCNNWCQITNQSWKEQEQVLFFQNCTEKARINKYFGMLRWMK